MTTKTTGLELKAFYNDATYWPEGVWHEDEALNVNGVDIGDTADFEIIALSDTDIVKVTGGAMFNAMQDDIGSFEGQFKKWRKEQNTTTLLVRAPNAKLDDVRAAVKAAGGEIL